MMIPRLQRDSAVSSQVGRRAFLASALAMISALAIPRRGAAADDVSMEMVLNDPDAPVGGNPKGSLTMVAFLDYNCPWCKKSAKPMQDAVRQDGNVRLVYKELPVITEDSVQGARLALAAKYQEKYQTAHDAMMNIEGPKVKAERMLEAIRGTDIDLERLQSDLNAHQDTIMAVIERNMKQAEALGLNGTPAFIVGNYLVPGAIQSKEEFLELFAKAREQG